MGMIGINDRATPRGPGPAGRTRIQCQCGGDGGLAPSGVRIAGPDEPVYRIHATACKSCGKTIELRVVALDPAR